MGRTKAKRTTISAINEPGQRALTFVELALVAVIIATLAGVALPRLSGLFSSLQLDNFASRLQDEISYWHERAIVERKPLILKIASVEVPSGLNLQAGEEEIVFYPDGRISKITVKITNSRQQEISLTTEGVFGGAKIIQRQ